jgi:hypothetical protein
MPSSVAEIRLDLDSEAIFCSVVTSLVVHFNKSRAARSTSGLHDSRKFLIVLIRGLGMRFSP